jgi:hypothetical protein
LASPEPPKDQQKLQLMLLALKLQVTLIALKITILLIHVPSLGCGPGQS